MNPIPKPCSSALYIRSLTVPVAQLVTVPIVISQQDQQHRITALLDCGACSCFINVSVVERLFLETHPLPQSLPLRLIDDTSASLPPVTHYVTVPVATAATSGTMRLFVANIGSYDAILGLTWLKEFNPDVDWVQQDIRPRIDASAAGPHTEVAAPLPLHHVAVDSAEVTLSGDLAYSDTLDSVTDWVASAVNNRSAGRPSPQLRVHAVSFGGDSPTAPPPTTAEAEDMGGFHDLLDPDDYVADLRHRVPPQYHGNIAAFSKAAAQRLPPRRRQDHDIKLVPGAIPVSRRAYQLSEPKLEALHAFIKEMLALGFIRESASEWGAPVLMVKKGDGWRPCFDYRGLNALTVKDKTPIPLINETFDRLRDAGVFTKLDLRGAFNLLRIAHGCEDYTTFRTRWGSFACLVMPFGLSNAPASFQSLMNSVFRDIADVFVVIYLDDILVYSANQADHDKHVNEVLRRLVENHLYVKAEKCEFSVQSTTFLGHVVSTEGISIDPARVEAIVNWPEPRNSADIEKLRGFANSYRRYIHKYADISVPIDRLANPPKAGTTHDYATAVPALNKLKAAFQSTEVLRHFNPILPTLLETDASGFAIAGILSQTHDGPTGKEQRPVGFFSRKLTPTEQRYPIAKKELLAIYASVKHWLIYLEACQSPFTVYTDHQALQYWQSSHELQAVQARWSEEINHLNYTIQYRKAEHNLKADVLSRRPDWEEEYARTPRPTEPVIRPQCSTCTQQLEVPETVAPYRPPSAMLTDQADIQAPLVITRSAARVPATSPASPTPAPVLPPTITSVDPSVCHQDPDLPHPLPRFFTPSDGITGILYRGKRYVPDGPRRTEVLRIAHDAPAAGHGGREKTMDLVKREYNWPGLDKFCARYCESCAECQASKPQRTRLYGPLMPLPAATAPFLSLSWDHVGPLPMSDGYDMILVITCRFTKMVHFIPTRQTDTARELARQFIHHIFRLHGLPTDIVSDRGATFASAWWGEVCKQLGIKRKLSTSFRPQTNGSSERVHQSLEHMLRITVNYDQNDWAGPKLDAAEFAFNNSVHTATRHTPFYLNHGYHPRTELSPSNAPTPTVPDAASFVAALRQARLAATEALATARSRMLALSDTRTSPAPSFKVGDRVLVNAKHIDTTQKSKKLTFRFIGPYTITHQTGPVNFRVDIPSTARHNVFHVDRLRPYISPESFPHREVQPRPPAEIPETNAYLVSRILDSTRKGRKLFYLVDWEGYGREDRQWVRASEFDPDDSLVQDFRDEHPSKETHS